MTDAQWISVLLRIQAVVHGHRSNAPPKPVLFTTPEIANTVSTKVGVAPAPRNPFGVRLRATCLLSWRFDHAQPPPTRLSLANLGNSLSPRHFAENAALGIDVGHFSSVVYEWRLPCMPEYVETWIPATDDELMQGRN